MINKCKNCPSVRKCNIRHGFKDLCKVLPPPIQQPKIVEEDPEAVPLEHYQGKELTVGMAEPYSEWGQLVERRKGRISKQEIAALKLEFLKSKHRLFAKSSAKSALLDDSKYVPDEALSFDPEAHESQIGGWIPENEPELPPMSPIKWKVLSGRKTSPFSLKLETEMMHPSGMRIVTEKDRRTWARVRELRQLCKRHIKMHPDQKLTLPLDDWLLLNKHGGVAPPSASGG